MATKKLARVVYVDGKAYGPGAEEDVPAEVLKQITNPLAFQAEAEDAEGS